MVHLAPAHLAPRPGDRTFLPHHLAAPSVRTNRAGTRNFFEWDEAPVWCDEPFVPGAAMFGGWEERRWFVGRRPRFHLDGPSREAG